MECQLMQTCSLEAVKGVSSLLLGYLLATPTSFSLWLWRYKTVFSDTQSCALQKHSFKGQLRLGSLHMLWRVYNCNVLTDDALDFGHQAAGWRRWGLLREVTWVEDVVHGGTMLTVVEQLIMFSILKRTHTNHLHRVQQQQYFTALVNMSAVKQEACTSS